MDIKDWLDKLITPDTREAAATKAGYAPSTISRQLSRGHLRPETVIALCRAYHYPPVDGLVETGYLSPDDLESRITVKQALEKANLRELWNAIRDIVDNSGLFIEKMPALDDMAFTLHTEAHRVEY